MVSDILLKENLATEREKFRATGACYLDVGGGQVARVATNFLNGEKPKTVVDGPAQELHSDKLEFETSRRGRWFRL